MGASLALNMADKGFRVSLYNRTRDKTDELIAGYAHKDRLTGTYDLKGLVESLAPPGPARPSCNRLWSRGGKSKR